MTEEQLDFTFEGKPYTLNRYWQVLGTEIHESQETQNHLLSRHIFYFGNHVGGEEDDALHFDELTDMMNKNEEEGGKW